jgi:phage gp37-like protein
MLIETEEALQARIKAVVGRAVRKVESHPGRWGNEVIKHMLADAPSVYTAFSMGRYADQGEDVLLGQWHVYVVARALNGQREVGVYQLLQALAPALHEYDLGQPDALRLKSVKNLFSYSQAKAGFCCYELLFDLPMRLEEFDPSSLDDWLRYHADHVDEHDPDHIMASADVEIPQ